MNKENKNPEESLNFIESIIVEDLKNNKNDGRDRKSTRLNSSHYS